MIKNNLPNIYLHQFDTTHYAKDLTANILPEISFKKQKNEYIPHSIQKLKDEFRCVDILITLHDYAIVFD